MNEQQLVVAIAAQVKAMGISGATIKNITGRKHGLIISISNGDEFRIEVEKTKVARVDLPVREDDIGGFPLKRVRDLLVGAFEGGSNYWLQVTQKDIPQGTSISTEDGEGEYYPTYIMIPTTAGCTMWIGDRNEEFPKDGHKPLNLDTLKEGMEVMKVKHPQHYAHFVEEEDDCETADVFLQCCLFGEIVFG